MQYNYLSMRNKFKSGGGGDEKQVIMSRQPNRVEILGIDEKRQIMALFACTMAGQFLPIKLIYGG